MEKFIGIVMGNDEPVLCPDIGSLANGKDKCNILVEKKQIVMGNADNIKSNFLSSIERGGVQRFLSLVYVRISTIRNQKLKI